MGVYHHRHSGFYLAVFLAGDIPAPGRAPKIVRGRARIHSVGSGGTDDEDTLGQARTSPADMGLRGRQIHDRSDLVGLSFLDAKIPEHELWFEDHTDRLAAGGYLRCG